MSDLQKSVLRKRLPIDLSGRRLEASLAKNARMRDYTPTQWSDYFAEEEDVQVNEKCIFHIYRTKQLNNDGPVLLLLHGGGYSGLTWANFAVEITTLIDCQCIAIDLRGHGQTITDNDDDLSAETLVCDILDVLKKVFGENKPSLYIVGHSMGGAIGVHFALEATNFNIIGLTVIDVVEGTAIEALASMQSFLRSRPTHFQTIPKAIEWCVRSGQIRNVDSAKVSMPGQIINCKTQKLATTELPLIDDDEEAIVSESSKTIHPLSIPEDEEEHKEDINTNFVKPAALPETSKTTDSNKNYTWRINLAKSEKYWYGWFTGLSEKFLSLSMPKQLILANIDGLDRTLTVGQMQGKFQMQVLARCGHVVHEDRPHEVAEVISSYMIKNRMAKAIGDIPSRLPSF